MALSDPFTSDERCLKASTVAQDLRGLAEHGAVGYWVERLKLTYDICAPDDDPAGRDVVITTMGKQYRTRLRWKALRLATHYTLDCPLTGKAVRALYAVNDKVGSREALGIRYDSRVAPRPAQREARYRRLSVALNGDGTRKASRGGKRDRILSQLSGLDPDLMDDRDRRAVLKWRRLSSVDDASMTAALGRGLSGYHMLNPAEFLDRLAVAAIPPDLSPRNRAALQRRGRFPIIDLTALSAASQEYAGAGWVLEYPDGTVVYANRVDSSEGAKLRLAWDGDRPGCQDFGLTEVEGALRTPCPVTGLPTGALFLRHGRWASAKAQRLS